MKALIQKDKLVRRKFSNQEINQKVLSYAFRNLLNGKKNSKKLKMCAFYYIHRKQRSFNSKTKIVRRCVLTGRSRSSSRKTGISRIKLKELVRDKKIRNISKI